MCIFSYFTWRKDFFLLGTYLWRFSLIFMTGFTLLCALLLFSLLIPLSLCIAFYSISSNIDQVLLINPSANVFVFGDFNVHHKDWITYSGGTDRSGELSYNFSYDLTSYDLTWWLTLLLTFEVLTVLIFLTYFFLLLLVFVPQWLSLHCEILIMLLC